MLFQSHERLILSVLYARCGHPSCDRTGGNIPLDAPSAPICNTKSAVIFRQRSTSLTPNTVMNSPTYPTYRQTRAPLDPVALIHLLETAQSPIVDLSKTTTPERGRPGSPITPAASCSSDPCAQMQSQVELLEQEIEYFTSMPNQSVDGRMQYWQQRLQLTEQIYALVRAQEARRTFLLEAPETPSASASGKSTEAVHSKRHGCEAKKLPGTRKRPLEDDASTESSGPIKAKFPKRPARARAKKRRITQPPISKTLH